MKIRYLGTAAAEGIPGMFCGCRICQNALRVRGKEVKTRSQALVDEKILVDFPPDTYMHILNCGLDLRPLKYCIITHAHNDHFYVDDFWCRLEGIAHDIEEGPMHIYLTEAGYQMALACHGENADGKRLKFHKIEAFVPFMIEDYRITPIGAQHSLDTDPVIYVIEHDGKALLYANDTGYLPETSWEYLAKMNVRLDFVSLDCTYMLAETTYLNHMGLNTNQVFYQKLLDLGLCDEHTVVYLNHFSHNGNATHEEFVREAEKVGYGVSYDGLEVEF